MYNYNPLYVMEDSQKIEGSVFGIMAGMLEGTAYQLAQAADFSEAFLYRPEMRFLELREHLKNLAALYRRQLAHKAFVTHRAFSVKKAAKRKIKPLTEERRQQLIAAGRKGGSKTGSLKKSQAAKSNGAQRWRKAGLGLTRGRGPDKHPRKKRSRGRPRLRRLMGSPPPQSQS